VEGLEEGADDYLVKPMPAEELKARVRNILRRKPAADQAEESALPTALPIAQVVPLLVQVADLAIPGAANRALQIAAAAQWLAESLHLEAALRPDLDLAAHLHELGRIGLPPRLWRQRPSQLQRRDWETFRAFPVVTQVLMRHVEAFGRAAGIVRHLYENWDGSGVPDHLHQGRIPLGSRILRALADFFEDPDRLADADSRKQVLQSMQERGTLVYDPAVLAAVVQYVQHHLDASLAQNRRYVRVDDLRPGMRLAADLITNSGTLLLRQNELLGVEEVRRIERHHAIDPFLFSIAVYPSGEK
jgi:response regulator RpfG family c-di-GMP phosphodiesterase